MCCDSWGHKESDMTEHKHGQRDYTNYVILFFIKISYMYIRFRSDQISCSVVSDSLRPHESQHARPPCPSSTPGVHSNSHPSSQ